MRKTPLKRKTPLGHKSKKKPTSAKTLCTKADALARAYCKADPVCAARAYTFGTQITQCSGRPECCHLKSCGHKTIRHDPLNFVCMCHAHHKFFTRSPDEWTRFIEATYPGRWDRLNAILLEGGKPNYEYWVDYYTRRIAS